MNGLPAGKLPPVLLDALLARYASRDASQLVLPGVGVDAAVLDLGETLLVLKSDPITFATERIGWYAVHVNANDIACMGATPRWFLGTLLLPPGITAEAVEAIFAETQAACAQVGVALVGGHTEVTHGLDRPLLAGTMVGTVSRDRLVRPDRAREGDRLVIASGFPIEGAALIAQERGDELRRRGLSDTDLQQARSLLDTPGISVLKAARIATDSVPVRALHDPTEGGIATGLREVAMAAGGLGFEVDAEALPLLPLGARLCAAFGLDPLGTIASGALIIVVRAKHSAQLVTALTNQSITASVVGRLLRRGEGAWLVQGGQRRAFPLFPVDEITKLFGGEG